VENVDGGARGAYSHFQDYFAVKPMRLERYMATTNTTPQSQRIVPVGGFVERAAEARRRIVI
jgi:hypothetical protein